MIYRVTSAAFALALAVALACGSCAAEELKQISEKGITVHYPAGMEAPAKKVLSIFSKSLPQAIEVNKELAETYSDLDSISKHIATLLGAEEKQDETKQRLQAYRDKSRVMVRCFTNIKLVETSEAVVNGGVDAGLMRFIYNEDTNDFAPSLSVHLVTEEKLKNTFFPVLINADNSIRGETKLDSFAVSVLGTSRSMLVAPVHETVAFIMAQELGIYHPFTRWFNEGVSGWITRAVVTKIDPKLSKIADELFNVSSKSKGLSDKINLYSWPQVAFQNKNRPYYDNDIEIARTQYAIELMTKLLGKNGEEILPKIMRSINYSSNNDTDTICKVIDKITGKNSRNLLLSYVPENVRGGTKTRDNSKQVAEAKELVKQKKWKEAADRLRLALDMVPNDVNTRLNLAWVERELGENLDSEIQIFTAARLLKQGEYSFNLFEGTVEGNYVLGRLAILLGDLEYAKDLLSSVLSVEPNHKAAKRGMEEITALESATRGK